MRTQDLANNEEDDVEQQQQHLLRKKHKIRLVSRGHSSWGQFNITPSVRSYLPMFSNLVQFKSVYHTLLDLTWWKLFLGFGAFYLVLHALFALLYWMGGNGVLDGKENISYMDCFFFSVQTISTIGYGKLYPANIFANIVVMVQSWYVALHILLTNRLGMFFEAFVIALVYGKFTRPTLNKRNIRFSQFAVVAPYKTNDASSTHYVSQRYRDEEFFWTEQQRQQFDLAKQEASYRCWYLELRFMNLRKAQITDTRFHLLLLVWQEVDEETHLYQMSNNASDSQSKTGIPKPKAGHRHAHPKIFELDFVLNTQQMRPRTLEYSTPYLPLPLSVMHRIDKTSPLYPMLLKHEQTCSEEMRHLELSENMELIAVIDAVDESCSDAFQVRFSYTAQDIIYYSRFAPCVSVHNETGKVFVEHEHFDQVISL